MSATATLLQHLRLVQAGGRNCAEGVPEAESGKCASPPSSGARAPLIAAGSAAAALVAVACAFGPVPDRTALRDTPTTDEAGIGRSRDAIDNFLRDSRRYLGL